MRKLRPGMRVLFMSYGGGSKETRRRSSPTAILSSMPGADRHIDDDDLERYVLDQLSEDNAAAIEEHLLICEQCQDQLAQVDQRVQAMRASLRRLA